MQFTLVGRSDVGRRREKNEDNFLINNALGLFMVADGMGGHQGGEAASRIAVETVEDVLKQLDGDPELTIEEGESIQPGDFQSYLRHAVSMASNNIYEQSAKEAALKGMGTTAVAGLFRKNMVYIANVGDSRAYRIRDEAIEQITEDHSLVAEQIKAGILSVEDAKTHRLKNIITRSVGFQNSVEADIDIRSAKQGDIFLLCSDGLSNLVEDDEMRQIILSNKLDDACIRLIDLANERGGDDNITVVLAQVDKLSIPEDLDYADDETIEV